MRKIKVHRKITKIIVQAMSWQNWKAPTSVWMEEFRYELKTELI